jgi:hypothetical protein
MIRYDIIFFFIVTLIHKIDWNYFLKKNCLGLWQTVVLHDILSLKGGMTFDRIYSWWPSINCLPRSIGRIFRISLVFILAYRKFNVILFSKHTFKLIHQYDILRNVFLLPWYCFMVPDWFYNKPTTHLVYSFCRYVTFG